MNVQKASVINPRKTQGISELHHKSTKRTVLSSSKERIDNLVACLVQWKEAKRRAYNVQVTRSKEGLKWKTTTMGFQQWDFKLAKLVKETWRPRKWKMHKVPGSYQQDKAKKKLGSNDKKDEDNGLQKSYNENITFKHKPNKDLDHLVNNLEKDTEIKENETKTKSKKFVPDADTNIGKEKKRSYQKGEVKLDFTRRKKRKREPIVRKKSSILINDEPRNKMIEFDGSTVLLSPTQ